MEERALANAIDKIAAAKLSTETSDYARAAETYGIAVQECEKALMSLSCTQVSTLISNDDFENAKTAANKIVSMFPSFAMGWFWKGTALYKLNDQKRAKSCFEKAASFEKDLTKKTSYMDWASRCQVEPVVEGKSVENNAKPEASTSSQPAASSSQQNVTVSASDTPAPEKRDNTRMQWYQSGTFVNVDIYAKNVIKEESSIEFKESSLHVHLKRKDGPDYILEKTLFEPIKPEESKWNVNKFKAEIHLKKARQGNKWLSLDKEEEVMSAAKEAAINSIRRMTETEQRKKQWNKFAETELKDCKEDDSSMSLLRKIYADADDDVRRAMAKSYSESGGQVLSTDWEKVKKEKVTYNENEKEDED